MRMLRKATIWRRSGILAASAASRRSSRLSASPRISNWRSTAERRTRSLSKFAKLLPAVIPPRAVAALLASHGRLFRSRFKDGLARPLDALLEIGIANRARLDKVDATAEQRLKRLFEAEKGLERQRLGRPRIELDQEIKIAARRVEIVTRRRAEQVKAADVEPATQFPQFLSI